MAQEVLVTGGAGFMGSHVADELVRMGYRVIVLDDLSGGFRENLNPACYFVAGSILDVDLLERVFSQHDVRCVFHLAAYAAEGLSHFIKRFNYQNNLIGTVNLINQAVTHNVDCFVFTSSIAVYGLQRLPMTEDMIPRPEDSYGIAKLAVEQELRVSHEMFGLNYVIFRPHNVYGERQNIGDKYRNVIGIFMNQILQGLPMTIFGDGKQTRAFTHVSDVAPLIASAPANSASYQQVFNLGSDEPFTVEELAHKVAEVMGVEPRLVYVEPRNEVKHAYCSHEKLKRFFQVPAPVPLVEGVRRMAEWARRAGARRAKALDCIEIRRNLPRIWLD